MMKMTWPEMKNFALQRDASIQYLETDSWYYLRAFDTVFSAECDLNKNASDQSDIIDFETNFKSWANKPLSQLDSDGAAVVRNKAAKKGWTYQVVPIEFETSRLSDTLHAKHADGSNRAGITMKAYNASDVEVTTPGLAGVNYATITKTVIDFEPAYDYEVIGGYVRTINDITADLRLYIVAVPDIPAGSGGSKEMCGGLNLNFMKPENVFSIDGRASKFLSYHATLHTGKLRLILKYGAGVNERMMISIEHYRQ